MRAAHETHGRLRVLHVLGELRASGAETMLKGSLPVMAAAGVEVSVLSTGNDVGEFGSVLEDLGVQVHHLPFRARPLFLLQLVKLARKHDVVHLHTERASFWLGASMRAASVPVIRTVHNTFLFTGKLKMVRGAQRRALRRLGVTFVAIGRDVADNERDRFGVSTVLVPNWAESRYFDNRERSPDGRHPLIVSVGNCGSLKNHDSLIRALASLHAKGLPFRYRHLGSQADAVLDEGALAQELGCADAVDFVGVADPLQHLQEATAFVMPSKCEGLGIAALEALAAGVPTLLTDVPGLREFSEVPGIWWSSPTTDGLATAIEAMLAASDVEREGRAAAGADHVKALFSPEASMARLVELYRASVPRQALR